MKKNLIYYCYFENGEVNEFTNLNLILLKKYKSIFDGQIIFKLAVDDVSADYSKLLDSLKEYNPQIVLNNCETRESEYFIESIKEIKDRKSITFFAHNKGGSNRPEKDVIKLWLLSMYHFNLDETYLANIEKALSEDKTFSGIMRITVACPPWVESDWHYSGTFFWFNTEKLMNIDGWDDMKKDRFAVESYPGKVVDISQSHITICSEPFNFNTYSPMIWNHIIRPEILGEQNFYNFQIDMEKYLKHDRFSVIIPTIWKSEYTLELIKRYCESDYVGEVILINNRVKDTADIEPHFKLKMVNMDENIFVNPAWNYGVSLSKYKNITISNDDILFDVDAYYYYLSQALTQTKFQQLGFIGSHSDNYIISENKQPVIQFYNNQTNNGGWGCLFSFDKENWKPIPEQLKIWYGDNWIHMYCERILDITGINIETKMSTSSDLEEIREVRDNDTNEWHKLLGI